MEEQRYTFKASQVKKSFHLWSILIIISILPIVIFLGQKNIYLFHFIIELVIIFLCFNVATIIYNTKDISKNKWFSFLGVYFSFICIFELSHVVFHEGVNIGIVQSIRLSYIFSLCVAYIMSLGVMLFLENYHKNKKVSSAIHIFLAVPIIMLILIHGNMIPNQYFYWVTVGHLNPINEITIVLIYIINMVILYFKRKELEKDAAWYITTALIFGILSKLSIIFYIKTYDASIIMSHYFKLAFIFLIYRAIVKGTLKQPVRLLNTKLLEKNYELQEALLKLNNQYKELKEAEEELAAKEKTYNNLVENLPIAVLLRKGNKIVFVNDRTVTLLKAESKEQIIGKSIYDLVHPDYLYIVKKEVEEVDKGEIVINSQEKILDTQGCSLDVEITTLPVNINNEEIVMVLFRDLASLKLSEAMGRELKAAKENEKLRTEFFANLSHEFRTPINVIYSSCQLIDLYIERGNAEKVKNYNKIIKQNCYRIIRLTNNLIDATRFDEGFYAINCVKVDFVKVVEDVVLSVSSYIKDHGIEIIFDTDVEEKTMICDVDKIERIILNLLSNAVKFRRDNKALIMVNLKDRGDSIELRISDNGIGIPIEKQKVLFERFSRADRSLTRKQEGSGLGLYIAKSLVKMHKGSIRVNSKENEGTEFIIDFPVLASEEECQCEKVIETRSISEKAKIEFSDIYDF
ncbi:MASE3 domain-containing sensor histidine kinase [Clostridium polynesiense]|uniref:MASE3 domain-containing sensor histidine kinase n=1 Tax=Clostridium polynesiense TaxID=1325933 RepID=UPI00058C7E72|nr:MASE3 domain-containing protein [Clostridium polynesiense]